MEVFEIVLYCLIVLFAVFLLIDVIHLITAIVAKVSGNGTTITLSMIVYDIIIAIILAVILYLLWMYVNKK